MDLVICVEIEFIGFIYGLVCSIKDRIELEIFFWDFCLRNKVNGMIVGMKRIRERVMFLEEKLEFYFKYV